MRHKLHAMSTPPHPPPIRATPRATDSPPACPSWKCSAGPSKNARKHFAAPRSMRVKLDMLKRNALIAAGNALMQADDAALRQRITELADGADEPELVRQTARQVLERLGPAGRK